jgi:hypothetical protein
MEALMPDVTHPIPADLCFRLASRSEALLALVADFIGGEPTPDATFAFEKQVADILRNTGRDVLEIAFNLTEKPIESCPLRVCFRGQTYRRRSATANVLGTLFGFIVIRRCVYECLEPGEPCCWPLELRLGIVAGLATSALAERISRWSADHEQQAVLAMLRTEHGVSWSVRTPR